MKIKVCGITELDQIMTLDEMQVDFIGINFYQQSKRYYSSRLLLKDVELFHSKKVGVFVNEAIEEIKRKVDFHNLDYVQLHGDESAEHCFEISKEVKVIKAISSDKIDGFNYDEYKGSCTYFLYDNATNEYGGSGDKFDWTMINDITTPLPYFIAGGISTNDIGILNQLKNVFAIDINSKFETTPGIKDINLIKEFITKLNRQ